MRLRVDDAVHRITVRPGEQDELLYTGWAFTNEVELAAYLDRLRLAGIEVDAGHRPRSAATVVSPSWPG